MDRRGALCRAVTPRSRWGPAPSSTIGRAIGGRHRRVTRSRAPAPRFAHCSTRAGPDPWRASIGNGRSRRFEVSWIVDFPLFFIRRIHQHPPFEVGGSFPLSGNSRRDPGPSPRPGGVGVRGERPIGLRRGRLGVSRPVLKFSSRSAMNRLMISRERWTRCCSRSLRAVS